MMTIGESLRHYWSPKAVIPRPIPIKQTQIIATTVLNTVTSKIRFSPGWLFCGSWQTHTRTHRHTGDRWRAHPGLFDKLHDTFRCPQCLRHSPEVSVTVTPPHRCACETHVSHLIPAKPWWVNRKCAGSREAGNEPTGHPSHICVHSVLHVAAVILISLIYFPSYSTWMYSINSISAVTTAIVNVTVTGGITIPANNHDYSNQQWIHKYYTSALKGK